MKVVSIQDHHNPLKRHVFKIANDYHIWYNQVINNRFFYDSFERTSRNHGYYGYLKAEMKRQGVKSPKHLS